MPRRRQIFPRRMRITPNALDPLPVGSLTSVKLARGCLGLSVIGTEWMHGLHNHAKRGQISAK